MEPHLSGLLPRQPRSVEYVILKAFFTGVGVHIQPSDSRTAESDGNNFWCSDAAPPPRPLCPPSSVPPHHATTAGPPAASRSPSRGSCTGRRDARVHRPKVPGRSSPPVPRESLHPSATIP